MSDKKKCLECGNIFNPVANGQIICDDCAERHTQDILDEQVKNFKRRNPPD